MIYCETCNSLSSGNQCKPCVAKLIREKRGAGKTKAYISGQITGLDIDVARSRFEYAARRLTEMGYEPVNPLDNGLSENHTWSEHMRADLKFMLDCQAIYLLRGWQYSRGARLEKHIADELGFEKIEQVIEKQK